MQRTQTNLTLSLRKRIFRDVSSIGNVFVDVYISIGTILARRCNSNNDQYALLFANNINSIKVYIIKAWNIII